MPETGNRFRWLAMLDVFKAILGAGKRSGDRRAVVGWARKEGYLLRTVREGSGFVVEGDFDGNAPWRLEWGPPQRAYIAGRELRLRIEAGLATDLQMLVMNRSLAEKLERETFEQFTQSTQTYVDAAAPEEMRWLAMFSRGVLAGPKPLRRRYAALAMEPAAATAWLDASLAARLGDTASPLLGGDPSMVLMTLRGRIYLRVELLRARPAALAEALAIGSAAVVEARRISSFRLDSGDWPVSSLLALAPAPAVVATS